MRIKILTFAFISLLCLIPFGAVLAAVDNTVSLYSIGAKIKTAPMDSFTASYTDIAESLQDLPVMSIPEITADFIDNLIKEHNFKLNKNERLPRGISAKDYLRIKIFACLVGKSMIDTPTFSLLDSKVVQDFRYDKIEFFLLPEDKQFIIYPGVDAKTFGHPVVLGKSGDVKLTLLRDKKNIYLSRDVKLFRLNGIDVNSFYSFDIGNYVDDFSGGSSLKLFKNKKGIYYFLNDQFYQATGVQMASLKYFSNGLAKDKSRVYLIKDDGFWVVKGADATSLNFDNSSGALMDKKNLYFLDNEKELKKIDIIKYKFLPPNIFKSKTEVFAFNFQNQELEKIEGAHANSFSAISGTNNLLFQDKNWVYLFNGERKIQRLEQIDRATFSLSYSQEFGNDASVFADKNGSYFISFISKGNDNNGIQIMPEISPETEYLYHSYGFTISKDSKNVYYTKNTKRRILTDADSVTFKIVRNDSAVYCTDKNNVYVPHKNLEEIIKLDGADSATFEVIIVGYWNYYAKDKNSVWYYDNDEKEVKKITDANPANFNFNNHAKQLALIKKYGEDISKYGIDPDSLHEVNYDVYNVWLRVLNSDSNSWLKVEGADSQSFRELQNIYVDKNKVWIIKDAQYQSYTNVDVTSLEPLTTYLFRDKNHLWFYDQKIDSFYVVSEVDGPSIQIINSFSFGDAVIFKDLTSVWFYSRTNLQGNAFLDVNSFVKVFSDNNFIYKDNDSVYFVPINLQPLFVKIDNIDSSTLKLVESHDDSGYPVIKDKKATYRFDSEKGKYVKKY